jgi:hypothetical protein
MGEFVHVYNDGGGIRNANIPNTPLSISGNRKAASNGNAQIFEFEDMVPKICPSLTNGTTAAQAGSTVTVTVVTAHGIPSATYNGWKVWYPGSTNIAAGWYSNFLYLTADTFSFTASDSKTVASESVNGGVAVTAYVEFYKLTLPGGTLGKNGRATVNVFKFPDTTANSKGQRIYFGGSPIAANIAVTAAASGMFRYTFSNVNSEAKQRGTQAQDGYTSLAPTSVYAATADSSQDQVVSIQASNSAGGGFFAIQYADLEVKYNA